MMRKTKPTPTCNMIRVYQMTADVSSPRTTYARVRREAAERMVDDRRARWVSPDAIQRMAPISGLVFDRATISDSECEVNAGAYAGRGRGAAERLSHSQMEEVRRKIAAWSEIYDEKVPLPGHHRSSNCSKTARGVTLMSRGDLEKLSGLQVVFVGSETRPLDDLFRKNRTRLPDNDFLQQHYVDDERESLSEVAVGYHDIDGSEVET